MRAALQRRGPAMTTPVTLTVHGPVATITLSRPEARNMLDAEAMTLMRDAIESVSNDPAVRVAVLTGEGSTFCAGADLRGAATADAESFAGSGPQALVDVLEGILDSPIPFVARVQGHVAGGGNGLVAACDLSVAVDTARFAFSEVRVGVAPAVISVVCLARMAPAHAAELLLTGERVSAERVREAGLVNSVVTEDALDATVSSYVDALVRGGPAALAATKRLLHEVPRLPRAEAFSRMAALSASLFSSDEARDGMTAFLERRPAGWVPAEAATTPPRSTEMTVADGSAAGGDEPPRQ